MRNQTHRKKKVSEQMRAQRTRRLMNNHMIISRGKKNSRVQVCLRNNFFKVPHEKHVVMLPRAVSQDK